MTDALVIVLGDQLSPDLASLRGLDRASTRVLLAEAWDGAAEVRHHKKKIALALAAMRHHAAALAGEGWAVDHVALDAPGGTGSLTGEVGRAVSRHRPARLRVVEAGEHRVQAVIEGWAARFGLPIEVLPDDRFIASREGFRRWAGRHPSHVMEDFYRAARRKTGLLMDGDAPAGGRWNLDAENRKPAPRGLSYPGPARYPPDATTRAVLDLVAARFPHHFGDLEPFGLPVTRAQALDALGRFVRLALPRFGDYQDAMVDGEALLYHSMLSPAMNLGLLLPLEVARAAEAAYRAGEAPLNAVEGFVRQVIGWREYVRGHYWLEGPAMAEANALGARRPLPDFYWTGDTPMRCVAEAVDATRREAYAHHVQRLMVLGNFALLAGLAPREVQDWFLVVYADAHEWVELPNVAGMALHADGGRLATKPYAASGAYIDRMSDHCGRCAHNVRRRTGPGACPFNALYWDFLARHEARFRSNRRMRHAYATWDRLGAERRGALRASAAAFLATLRPAAPGWARPPAGGGRG